MDRQIVADPYNVVLLIKKKKRIIDTCYNMVEY